MISDSANKKAFDELLSLCRENLPRCDLKLIEKAYHVASIAHSEEYRQSKEPYLTHPIAVAKILATEIPFDDVSVACALLHDVVENNSDFTIDMIRKEMGNEIAAIVAGLTKTRNLFKGSEVDLSENYRRLLMSVIKDIRVIIVKFADRLNNMRTLNYLDADKRKRIAKETMDVYAPLAHRFGLGKLKQEFEDYALQELSPQAYDELKKKLNAETKDLEKYFTEFLRPIYKAMLSVSFQYEINGRVKHINSIYRKMIKRNKPFEEIFDLFAVRVIIDSDNTNDCYLILGIVNNIYLPVADRFKDYIAIPKTNNYQSLHTTVIGPDGRLVEVQIRTRKMHEIAEKGVAAHWRYKEGSASHDKTIDQYVNWIREVIDSSGADDLRKNIIENFKMNLYTDEIYVFTPKGDLKRLPLNSTPIDFAYAIHSSVGFSCVGAKVNQRLVPLDTVLHSGDQVEILTSKSQHPNKNWLKSVQTTKAKSEIKKWLNKEEEQFVIRGQEIWEKKSKKMKLNIIGDDLVKFVHEQKFANTRLFFKAIGQNKVDIEELVKLSKERDKKALDLSGEFESFTQYARTTGGKLLVNGDNTDLLISYSKCCNPIPGDMAVGYISKGEGVRIHRQSCKTLQEIAKKDPERVVTIQWPEAEASNFIVGLYVFGEDSPGILNEIAHSVVNYQNTNIKSINIDTNDSFFEGTVTLYVKNLEHLSRIIDRLHKIKGMSKVSRLEG